MQLFEMVAVVTGATSVVGQAVAKTLFHGGASVFVADSDDKRGRAIVEELRAHGSDLQHCSFVRMDVTDSGSVAAAVAEIGRQCNRVDIVVTLAEGGAIGPYVGSDEAAIETAVSRAILGPIRVARAFLPGMIKNGGGKIINVSAEPAADGHGARNGIASFTHELAREVGKFGISVNCIQLGPADTRLAETVSKRPGFGFCPEIRKKCPEKVSKMSAALEFLAAPASTYITGQVLDLSDYRGRVECPLASLCAADREVVSA